MNKPHGKLLLRLADWPFWAVFLFITLGLVIRNIHMRVIYFFDWDESIYTQVAKEIAQHWSLATTFNGHLWLAKPPLLLALIAAASRLFGQSEVLARSLSLICSLVLVILVYLLTKDIYTTTFKNAVSKLSSAQQIMLFLTPVLALGTSGFFIDRATLVNMDIFLATAWVGYFVFRHNYAAKLGFLCLGTLTKSLLGLFPLLIEIAFLNKALVKQNNWLKILGLLLVGLAWHIYSYFRYGYFFVQAHILDELVSRITTPIEFHFGGKTYYPTYLYQDLVTYKMLNLLLPLIAVAYIALFIRLCVQLYRHEIAWAEIATDWSYWILAAPVLYFIFLNLNKAKLYWYLYSLIPLLCLSLPYYFVLLRRRSWRAIFFCLVLASFLVKFIPETYAKTFVYNPSEKVVIARCLATKQTGAILFLEDQTERDARHVLEAANLQIGATFVYGGSPAFVYYSDKRVEFMYTIDEFLRQVPQYKTVMVSKKDITENAKIAESLSQFRPLCTTDNWSALNK